jgi:hypothetical protein
MDHHLVYANLENPMRLKYLAMFMSGLILGIAGMCVADRMMPRAAQEPNTIPPHAERREFNGMAYYIVPLATLAANREPLD